MREIKFRGMTLEGHLVHGLLAKTDEHGWTISNRAGRPFAYKVRPETIGQFTGLNDKNGVEIYEGDILHYVIEDEEYPKEYDTSVYWNSEHGAWHTTPTSAFGGSFYTTKVIGNIYENPELLK